MKKLFLLGVLLAAGCRPSNPAESQDQQFEEGRTSGRAGLARELNPYAEADPPSGWSRETGHKRARWFAGHNQGLIEAKEKASK